VIDAYLITGLSSAAVAVLWVYYVRALEARRHTLAGCIDAALLGLGGALVLTYTREPWALVWVCLGGGLGTYAASRWVR
jgi:hypothetical protein